MINVLTKESDVIGSYSFPIKDLYDQYKHDEECVLKDNANDEVGTIRIIGQWIYSKVKSLRI